MLACLLHSSSQLITHVSVKKRSWHLTLRWLDTSTAKKPINQVRFFQWKRMREQVLGDI